MQGSSLHILVLVSTLLRPMSGLLASYSYGFNPYEQALSIIWKTLAEFDEDNLISCYGFGDENVPLNRKEAEFALSTLMEIPSQYKARIELNLLGRYELKETKSAVTACKIPANYT
nr:hypothetical protein [Tanacetum cinerariifolium]